MLESCWVFFLFFLFFFFCAKTNVLKITLPFSPNLQNFGPLYTDPFNALSLKINAIKGRHKREFSDDFSGTS